MGSCTSKPCGHGWIYVPVPWTIAQNIYQWGIIVCPESSLLNPPPTVCQSRPTARNMHITIATNVPDSFGSTLKRIAREHAEFTVRLGNMSSWKSDNREVVHVSVDGPRLDELNRKLQTRIGSLYEHPYSPHVTVAFCTPDANIAQSSLFQESRDKLYSDSWTIDHLVFQKSNGKKKIVRLK